MNFLQKKYVAILGRQLSKFHWKKHNLAACRCPICGDSQKKKSLTRFYFLEDTNGWRVYCHNCGYSAGFIFFLRTQNAPLYAAYVKDKITFEHTTDSVVKDVLGITQDNHTFAPATYTESKLCNHCVPFNSLAPDHAAVQYFRNRQIPPEAWKRFYWTDKFSELATDFNQEAYLTSKFDSNRVVIPFWNKSKEDICVIQGRSVDPNTSLRYVTLKSKQHENWQKVFGLEQVDLSKTHYILEGPIDSVFLPNAIAVAGLKTVNNLQLSNQNSVFVFDNEPRNIDVIKCISSAIKAGKKVVIFPDWIKQKDINEMVLAGISPESLLEIIQENTYSDLTAFMKFSLWSKLA